MASLSPENLTWPVLLGRWIQFAQASLALPDDAEGARWRQSVPGIINLQAVTFALADLHRLEPADHPVARDKAELLIEHSAEQLRSIWDGVPLPPLVAELVDDAARALAASSSATDQGDGSQAG